jgi:opacity protein-like surface antigen
MRSKLAVTALTVLVPAVALPRLAAAEGTRSEFGADLALLPVGKLHTVILNNDVSSDTATAFAVGATLGARSSLVSIAVAPRYIFNVNTSSGSGDAGGELDLRLRVAVGGTVAPRLSVRGYVAPGYSFIFPSSGDSAKGFALGFGGITGYEFSPGTELTVDAGYTLGYQKVTSDTVLGTFTNNLGSDYLHLGVGLLLTR